MNTIVIERVKFEELPQVWRVKFAQTANPRVTVRIEEVVPAEELVTDDPLFGMWRDREDMADLPNHVRKLRASRLNDDSRRDT